MPCVYDLRVPAHLGDQEPVVLERWTVSELQEVFPGTVLATVKVGSKRYRILANGGGHILKMLIQPGEKFSPIQPLATMVGPAKVVPYAEPSAAVEEEN